MHGFKNSKEAGKRLLPTSEVGARYNRSPRTIDRWVREGVIPHAALYPRAEILGRGSPPPL